MVYYKTVFANSGNSDETVPSHTLPLSGLSTQAVMYVSRWRMRLPVLGMQSEFEPIKKRTSPWDKDTVETVVVLACDVDQATPHAYEQMTPHGVAHCLSAFFPLSSLMKCSAWPGSVFFFLSRCMFILKQQRQGIFFPQASD